MENKGRSRKCACGVGAHARVCLCVCVRVCVCVGERRLICATSAQPAQGSSPLEKWVTFPDDVKSPSASPVCGALPKPPHAIPRPYNGNALSKSLDESPARPLTILKS